MPSSLSLTTRGRVGHSMADAVEALRAKVTGEKPVVPSPAVTVPAVEMITTTLDREVTKVTAQRREVVSVLGVMNRQLREIFGDPEVGSLVNASQRPAAPDSHEEIVQELNRMGAVLSRVVTETQGTVIDVRRVVDLVARQRESFIAHISELNNAASRVGLDAKLSTEVATGNTMDIIMDLTRVTGAALSFATDAVAKYGARIDAGAVTALFKELLALFSATEPDTHGTQRRLEADIAGISINPAAWLTLNRLDTAREAVSRHRTAVEAFLSHARPTAARAVDRLTFSNWRDVLDATRGAGSQQSRVSVAVLKITMGRVISVIKTLGIPAPQDTIGVADDPDSALAKIDEVTDALNARLDRASNETAQAWRHALSTIDLASCPGARPLESINEIQGSVLDVHTLALKATGELFDKVRMHCSYQPPKRSVSRGLPYARPALSSPMSDRPALPAPAPAPLTGMEVALPGQAIDDDYGIDYDV